MTVSVRGSSQTVTESVPPGAMSNGADVLAAEAINILEENKITSLLVADDKGKLVGALNIHDLFRAGIM